MAEDMKVVSMSIDCYLMEGAKCSLGPRTKRISMRESGTMEPSMALAKWYGKMGLSMKVSLSPDAKREMASLSSPTKTTIRDFGSEANKTDMENSTIKTIKKSKKGYGRMEFLLAIFLMILLKKRIRLYNQKFLKAE